MKLQVSIELQLQDINHQSDILSQLTPATEQFGKLFLCPVSAELTHVAFSNNQSHDKRTIEVGPIEIDIKMQSVKIDHIAITLTPIEFKLLNVLAERRGEPQSRSVLLSDVWKSHPDSHTRTVDVHIKRLRDKLGSHGNLIQTVSGVGYIIK